MADRYGSHLVLFVSALLMALGNLLFSISFDVNSINGMYFARFLVGLGGESLAVAVLLTQHA